MIMIMIMNHLTYYKYTRYENDTQCDVRYLTLDDLPQFEKDLEASLFEEMIDYSCHGCRYCCYGFEPLRYYCERQFRDKSELTEYLEDFINIDIIIEKVTFEPHHDGGFTKYKVHVWSLKGDPTYTKDFRIKFEP